MEDPARTEYLEPTRHLGVAIGLVLSTGLVAIVALFHFAPSVMHPLSEMTSVCDELAGYRRLMQWSSLMLVVPGAWLATYGRRILRSGQSPPPGAWVLHRVAIKRGAEVARAGWLLLALGVAIAAAPLYFWSDHSRLERASVGVICEGM